jgi:hypothetical protein
MFLSLKSLICCHRSISWISPAHSNLTVWRALIHRLHAVSKAIFGHLSPELRTVSTGMPGMYSAPHARIVGFLADFREGMPMTGHTEDRRIHDVWGTCRNRRSPGGPLLLKH